MAEAKYESVAKKGELRFTERQRLLFFGLPWTFTKFQIYDNDLVTLKGLFNQHEDDCYMYKISDVCLTRSLIQRIFGLSTIVLYTSDASDHTLPLKNIKHGHEIKDFIVENSERCRLMRRTVNMQNIGYDDMDGAGDLAD